MTAEHDTSRIVTSWLREDEHASADRVLMTVLARLDATPQRRPVWPPRRIAYMNKLLPLAAAVATLLVAVVGYNLLGSSTVQPPASQTIAPSPSAPSATLELLSVTGSFDSHGARIELTAAGQREITGPGLVVWTNVTGSMTAADVGGDSVGSFTVDLACARTTPKGLFMLGGVVTESKNYDDWAPVGNRVAIVIQRGSPVKAFLDSSDQLGCAALLGLMGDIGEEVFDASALEPINGTIDIKP